MTRNADLLEPLQLPPANGTRLLKSAAVTYNADARTVEATLSTGARVARPFGYEELEVSAAAVDLGRVKSGICSLLDAHNRFSVSGVLGKVESATIRNGELVGRIRFADTDTGRAAEGMVARGELTGVSIGYAVRKWQVDQPDDASETIYRAIDWELLEVSLVPVPADPQSLIRTEESNVKRNLAVAGAPALEPAATNALPQAIPTVAARQISEKAINAGLDGTAIHELLTQHERAPFTDVGLMAEIGRRYAARDISALTVNRHSATAFAQPANHAAHPAMIVRSAMENVLLCKMSGRAPEDARERELMGLTLPGMARQLLDARGENVRFMSDREVMERSLHTTSDFPLLLQASGNRYLVQQFDAAASGVKLVARRREAPDFRAIYNIKLGNFSALDPLNEAGEFTHKTIDEAGESYTLGTYGNIFALSRQAMINDDLGAFSDPLALMAKSAAVVEAETLAGVLTANSGLGAKMADTKTLYHAAHGNLAGSGGNIAMTTLSDARIAMRNQTAVDGKTFINAAPKFIVVGPNMETQAEQMVAVIAPTAAGDVNPFVSKLEVVCDPWLPGSAWRLFADSAKCPVLEYAYLSGQTGPQLQQKENFHNAGWHFRCLLDFGVGIVDHRGTYLNPGA